MAHQPLPDVQEQMKLIESTGFFDAEWYANSYVDVRRRRMDPLLHYATLGGRVQYRPSERFDLDGYIRKHPELKYNRVPALLHLALNGNTSLPITKAIHPAAASHPEKSLYDLKIDQFRHRVGIGVVYGSITAIIPTCGANYDLLDKCLKSLSDDVRVILVANGKKKVQIAERYARWDGVDVLVMQGSFNWSVANNLGARKAQSEYLLFLNDDVYGEKGWDRQLLGAFHDPDVRVAGPVLLHPSGAVQSAGCYRVPRGCTSAHIQFLPNHTRYVESVMGAAMMVKKGVFDAAQGFDSDYRLLMAETDFCMRVGLCVVNHLVRVIHVERTSRGKEEPAEDIRRFIEKHPLPVGQEWWGQFIPDGTPLQVLVMKLDHIGDSAVAHEAVRMWKRPGMEISWLVNPVAKALFEQQYDTYTYPYFHENASQGVLAFDKAKWQSFVDDLPPFDMVLDLRAHGETAHLLSAWENKGALTFSFGDKFFPGYAQINGRAALHNKQALGAFLGALPIGGSTRTKNGDVVVFCLASSSPVKSWPVEHWEALGKLLTADGYEVVQLMAPDVPKLKNVQQYAEIPLFKLQEWVSQRCQFFIGHDTGPTHLAALAGVPVVEIVSGLVSPNEWQGIGALVSLTMPMSCAPCYRQPCKMGNTACIRTVGAGQVRDLLVRLKKMGI